MFSRGEQIEVCSKEPGFLGSYYAAKVVSQLRKDLFVVEYKDLVEGVINVQPLVETVRLNEVRPVPPEIDNKEDEFGYLEQVDAFDNDGWWVGRVYGRTDNGDYVVYFETTGDEIAYPRSRLRTHLDWVKRKWVSRNNKKGRPRSVVRGGESEGQKRRRLNTSPSNNVDS